MPSKKKKYNARFPPARIKKIMQTDEDVGKVAAAVPIIISKALEMFMESLIMKACENTQARHAKTMTTSHLKKCILQESSFDFLKDLVENVPDLPANEEEPETKEPKQRKRRVAPSEGRERKPAGRKRKKKESEESEDDPESEDDGESSESHSNTGSASNTETASTSKQLPPCPSTSEQDDVFEAPPTTHPPPAPVPIPKIHIPTLFNSMNNEEDDDYDS